MRPGWRKGLEDKELDDHELFLEESDGPNGSLRLERVPDGCLDQGGLVAVGTLGP
jgi:hypothetical protein